MANFQQALKNILANEGGYVNDPNDPGGETNYGISRRQFHNEDIANMTPARASEIYRVHYWNLIGGDTITDQGKAEQIFDFAVNAGVTTAIKAAQFIVEVKQDGIIGPVTIQGINEADPVQFREEYIRERVMHYAHICIKRPSQLKFLSGWINRSFQ